jgi:hypothetical protein
VAPFMADRVKADFLVDDGVGAKRNETREQCSQKLFELAGILRKIFKKIINQKYIYVK